MLGKAITYRCNKCKKNYKKKQSKLKCIGCGNEVSISNDIPRFEEDDYVENFGFEWSIHQNTQIDNDYRKESKKHFELRFDGHLNKFKNAKVLDVGVGVGRYAKIAELWGAHVVGVDLSSSIDIAKKNLNMSKTTLLQASVFNLPFAPNSFDIIYSFGVLHHTPNPRLAMSKLVSLLKPGGILCITVYEKGSMYYTSRYARNVTTKLPNLLLYSLCILYVTLMYIPYKYLGLRFGLLGRLLPISLSNNFFEAILDTFDCYSPTYQFTYRESEIYRWFKEEKLKNVEFKDEPVTLLGEK